MKWVMIVYVLTAGVWTQSHTVSYPDAESCIQAQWQFTEANPNIDEIRASCETVD